MEKRIDFLQTNNSGKKRSHSSSASERENIEWTSPGAAEVAHEAKKPGGVKAWLKKLPFFKAGEKTETAIGKIPEKKEESQKEKPVFRLNRSHTVNREAFPEPEIEKEPAGDRDEKSSASREGGKKENLERIELKEEIKPYVKLPARRPGGSLGAKFRSFFRRRKNLSGSAPIILRAPEIKDEESPFSASLQPKVERKIDLAKSLKIKIPEAHPEKKRRDKQKKREEGEERDKEWTGGGFRGTNLIKEQISLAEVKRRVFASLALIAAAFLLLGALDYALIYWAKGKAEEKQSAVLRLESLKKEKSEKERSMAKVFTFENKLHLAKLLLDKHIYWTSFFNFLEKNTLSEVYYGNFDGDVSGSYSLGAKTKDFKSLTRQIEVFRANPLVKETGAPGGDYQESESSSKNPAGKNITEKRAGIDFEIKLILDKTIFNTLPEN